MLAMSQMLCENCWSPRGTHSGPLPTSRPVGCLAGLVVPLLEHQARQRRVQPRHDLQARLPAQDHADRCTSVWPEIWSLTNETPSAFCRVYANVP